MSTPANSSPIQLPALPNSGTPPGAAKGWAPVGADGVAHLEIALPISPGRGYAPALALTYRSNAGNSAFGFGWDVNVAAVTRCTRRAVPSYTEADTLLGPDAQAWMPECDANGTPVQTQRDTFNQQALGTTYTVTRHFPRVESDFARIEHWHSALDPAGFWRVQASDGSQHLYGKTLAARIADPEHPTHVAQWLLEESLNAHGEHIGYRYQAETDPGTFPHDSRAQRYLHSVYYGNVNAREKATPYLFKTDDLSRQAWHFHLIFDYGQRSAAFDQVPTYAPTTDWAVRQDPFSRYAYGFEQRTLRLCRQILMFHAFPDEPGMGPDPVLVKRLLLEHHVGRNGLTQLMATHEQAVDAHGTLSYQPPQEYLYQSVALKLDSTRYRPFEAFPGHGYQLLDLYGEGVPGLVYRTDHAWYYRAPLRAVDAADADAIDYGPAQTLPVKPEVGPSRPRVQALLDVDGDGRPEWVTAQPGMRGFFRLDPHPDEARFIPFEALPVELLHRDAVFADLMGSGLADLALVGPRSVRLYAHRQTEGFASGIEVAHAVEGDELPSFSPSPSDWVGFSDVLGSGQPHLVRIRHDEIKCWPNLGRGRFGKGRVLATLPFRHSAFNPANVLLADLDGCGASDLLYLTPDAVRIYLNRSGNGFAATPLLLPWPAGAQHDERCQVSLADVRGQGFVSLVISVMHPRPRHWIYDFFDAKPGLLRYTCNNLGTVAQVRYRSSAQEWLDEKKELEDAGTRAVSRLPFTLDLVKQHMQHDEITGNTLTQHLSYRQAYYAADERAFHGFGLLLQRDSDPSAGGLLSKRWFHTGQALDMPRDGYSTHDPDEITLGPTLLGQPTTPNTAQPTDHQDRLITAPTRKEQREAAYALRGLPLREELFALDAADGVPFSVQQHRYLVRRLAPAHNAQPWARLLPLTLESVECRYEQVRDDPVCQHQLNLRWDAYGCPVHSVTVHHARRKTADDTPPAHLTDPHAQRWWRDTHDSAQQRYYLSETLSQWIHHDQPDQWRLALPYRHRTNTWALPKGEAAHGLTDAAVRYERFIDRHSGPLGPQAPRELSGLSVQHYREPGGKGKTLAPGVATFQALSDYLETAELDPQALAAYRQIPSLPGQPTWDTDSQLQDLGYQPMAVFFFANAAEQSAPPRLWSVRRQFPRYLSAKRFYRLRSWRQTEDAGETTLDYDPYWCHVSQITQADGCVTQATYDYRLLLPVKVVDPNGTQQEVRYDGFGRVMVSSIHGQEAGKAVGFASLSSLGGTRALPMAQVMQTPETLLNGAASAWVYAPFSWMGTLAQADLRPSWVSQNYLLPGGQVRATARLRLKKIGAAASQELQALYRLINQAQREPVHCLMLQADRYPDDQARQIHQRLTHWDGWGRALQSKQKTAPGLAHAVAADGTLIVENQRLQQVSADPRWRVSERVEYNPQGLPIRVYRPYFADRPGFIDDASLRNFGVCDQHFYDATGRLVRTLNANGSLTRSSYWAWYTVSEDENDTAES